MSAATAEQIGTARCPPVVGLFGREVKLADRTTVPADEDYLRESILRPEAKVVARISAADAQL